MSTGEQPSPAQIRAARGLLGWTQQDLADRSQTARRTIATIEAGDTRVRPTSVAAVAQALRSGGVEFIGSGRDEGVRRT